MKLAFAGTPEFAVTILDALVAADHDVVAVLTQPDRRAGRGRRMTPSPVKIRAEALGLTVLQPQSLRGELAPPLVEALGVDALVVAAYGLILPGPVLAMPRLGCINVHASLLPRWRGAAPVQRAILAGDGQTGISIMHMDAGLDTGPVFATRATDISPLDTAGTLLDRLADLGAALLVDTLPAIADGSAEAVPQDDHGASYAARIDKAEARLDWRADAHALARRVRAFNPVPMAWTTMPAGQESVRLRVLRAQARPAPVREETPGRILRSDAGDLVVACGDGALALESVQPAGKRPMDAAAFNNAGLLSVGDCLE